MPWLTPRRLVISALAMWIAVAVATIAIDPPLGHDEAAFAVTARGDAPAGTWLYRSVGTVLVARLGLALGGAAWQLRLVAAALAVGLIAAVFAVGRAAFSARSGAWAAAVVAGAHPIVMRSAQLLSDLPAAAAQLAGIAILIGELDRDGGPRWRIVAAAPLLAAAFYLRYGSAPGIALAIGAAGIVWWPSVRARPGRAVASVAALAALIVPHVVHSVHATGSPLGVLVISAGMPRRAYVGEGLVTYLTANPLRLYGALAAPVMVAGVIGLVRLRRRAPWYLATVALGQITALGLSSHGQPRYIVVATVLLIVLGTAAALRVAAPPPWPGMAAAAVAAAWLAAGTIAIATSRADAASRAPIVRAAQVIRGDAAGRPCAILAAVAPQLTWYARCEVYAANLPAIPGPERARYAVSLPDAALDPARLPALAALRLTPLPTGDPAVQVWRVDATPPR